MKKFIVSFALFALAFSASAQGLIGVGYDGSLMSDGTRLLQRPGEITARIALGSSSDLDLGIGAYYNAGPANSDARLDLTASAFFLLRLQQWNMVSNYFTAGVILDKYGTMMPPPPNSAGIVAGDFGVSFFGGLQPEVTLLDHLVVGVRFGLQLAVAPEIQILTPGSPLSIVDGVNFKILF